MAVRSVQNLDLETLLSTSPAAYRGPLIATPEPASDAATPLDCELESEREGLRCTRGLLVGLVLEIGMALILYGAWQALWHLWHLRW